MLIPDAERKWDLEKVFIGVCTKEQEHAITLLKSAQLMMEVEKVCPTHQTKKTVKLTRESLIAAVDRMNENSEKRILSSLCHININRPPISRSRKKGSLPIAKTLR